MPSEFQKKKEKLYSAEKIFKEIIVENFSNWAKT